MDNRITRSAAKARSQFRPLFVNAGINDYAFALDLRGDNQLVAAGCSNQHLAGWQVRTDGIPGALPFSTDVVGYPDCAKAVKFFGRNKIMMAGAQNLYPFSSDSNIALARFVTTMDTTRLDQTITFPPLPDRLVSEIVTLSASASSGLVLEFRSTTPAICTLRNPTTLDLLTSGICTVVAAQAGNTQYNPAPQVSRSFTVRDPAKQEQTISIKPDPLPPQLPLGQPLALRATASSGLVVEILSSTPATCAVSGTTLVG
jgi:hypothetical protein